jgi:vitamin B12 transporter
VAALLFAGAALTAPTLAHADPSTPVGEVIVTATRLPAPLDVTPGAYVITEKDIELRQPVFAHDILDTVPSLSVFSTGPFGGLTSVRQRGADSTQTLVLIDGVPLNDASAPDGGFDFSAIDMADIRRVEVLNGPQGSLWGSDAIGGVIAFTTKEPNGVSLNLEGGSYGTARASGQIGESTDRWALGASVSSFSTNGISVVDPRNNYAPFGGPPMDNSDDGGDHALTASVRGRLDVASFLELDAQVRINQSRTDIAGFPAPFFLLADTNDVATSRSADAYIVAKIETPFDLHNEFSVDRYVLARGDTGEGGDFGFDATRDVFRWTTARGGVNDVFSFIVGGERQDTSASLSDGSVRDLGATSVFAVGQWRPVSALTTSASVRYDDPDAYHSQVTARFGAGYALPYGFSVTASWGQGFKTPSISETACDFCSVPPSSNLQPEHAVGEDAGLVWRSPDNRISIRATAFNLNVRDEIVFSGDFGPYVNLPRTSSWGVETQVQAVLWAGFSLQAAYTHDDAFDDTTGLRELRVPPNMASGSLSWHGGKVDAALSVRNEDEQSDTGLDGFTPVVRPGFTVANLTGAYEVNKHVTLTGRIENLGNTHYEESYGYNEPGRSIYVGLRLRD